jgi:serine/threonine protein phosphatase PrpC
MTDAPICGWGLSHPGQVRSNNEDNFALDLEAGAFAVSDGMGGRAAGEVASQMAIEGFTRTIAKTAGLRRSYLRDPSQERAQQLLGALRDGMMSTHTGIFDLAKRDSSKRGMGCTFTGLLLLGRHALLLHAGDSRAYLLRGSGAGRVQCLTQDHTVANFLLNSGQTPQDPAHVQGVKHILTNAFGVTPGLQIDGLLLELMPGDLFLLCSDGLHEYLPDEDEISSFWDRSPGAACCEALIQTACERGGKDNITAVIAEVRHIASDEEGAVCDIREELDTFSSVRARMGLSSPEFLQILSVATMASLEDGEEILSPDEHGRGYLLLKGTLKQGTRTLQEGSFVGARSLASGEKPSQSWRAAGPARVLVFHRETIRHLCFTQPHLGAHFLWGLLGMA